MTEPDTVTISKRDYEKLRHNEKLLYALYAGGVDNWEGYDACFQDEEEEDGDD